MFEYGRERIAQDPVQAVEWYQRAAAAGFASAKEALQRLQNEADTKQQTEAFVALEQKAMAAGPNPDPDLCYELGRRLASGLGRDQLPDLAAALRWYQRAILQPAPVQVVAAADPVVVTVADRAETAAASIVPAAASKPHADAAFALGRLYDQGVARLAPATVSGADASKRDQTGQLRARQRVSKKDGMTSLKLDDISAANSSMHQSDESKGALGVDMVAPCWFWWLTSVVVLVCLLSIA